MPRARAAEAVGPAVLVAGGAMAGAVAVTAAAVAHRARPERGAQHGEVFLGERAAVGYVAAEDRVFQRREAAADADFEPPARQHVERRHPLGDMHGVVQRQRDDGVADADAVAPRGGGTEQDFRLRGMRIGAHEMVFDQPGAAVAEFVSERDLGEDVGVERGFAARAVRGQCQFVKEVETHGGHCRA